MASECINGIPSIGIKLHTKGTEKWEDIQADIVSGDEIDTGIFEFIPELYNNLLVQEAIEEIIKRFPEKKLFESRIFHRKARLVLFLQAINQVVD